ncbi:MAG: energy-coupled thiamine transporter ThiT [Clostridia bacterium]|nr:energy-coupled thiamine transporter ThiT [Clostridia bacterium]
MFLYSTALAEETAEESTSFLSEVLGRFSELGATGWITLFTLVILAAIMVGMSVSRKTWTAKSMAYAALSIALSFVLSYIKIWRMPNSGSVTLASMLPLMLFAASYGVGPGLLAGAAYGMLQYLQGGWFVHPIQFLLDYPLAFALIGLAGVYKLLPKQYLEWAPIIVPTFMYSDEKPHLRWAFKPWDGCALHICMVLGALGRCLSATLAGIFYWDTAPWASLVYNGAYLVPDTLICIVLAVFVGKRIMKMMKN